MRKIFFILGFIVFLFYSSYDCIVNDVCGFGRAGRDVLWGTLTSYFKISVNIFFMIFFIIYLMMCFNKR